MSFAMLQRNLHVLYNVKTFQSVMFKYFSAVPTMPVNLTVVNYDHNFIYLSWSPPETSYGNLEGYRIVYQGFKQNIEEVYVMYTVNHPT